MHTFARCFFACLLCCCACSTSSTTEASPPEEAPSPSGSSAPIFNEEELEPKLRPADNETLIWEEDALPCFQVANARGHVAVGGYRNTKGTYINNVCVTKKTRDAICATSTCAARLLKPEELARKKQRLDQIKKSAGAK